MSSDLLTSLEGLVPPDQHLLASCFDAHHTIGGGLFAINGTVEEIDRVSSTGLHADDGLLYRCLWSAEGSPAELVAYDTTGVRRYHRLDDVSTPHDILALNGQVLVVGTTQNEVRCMAPDGRVAWLWRAPGEQDSWHLNSLAVAGDQIVVCGFGPFLRRRGWDENGKPATGQVVNLETGEPVLRGLHAPHNPHYSDGTWLICDSAAGDLVEFSDATRQEIRRLGLPGWPRGLAVTDRYLFVGVSPHRYLTASVETAAVAVVDRLEWRQVALVRLPAREVYALALVPSPLAEGARRGFTANHTRVHEQGQRQLFDRLGRRPSRLWAIGDRLAEEECRAEITLAGQAEERAETGSLLTVDCRVGNTGAGLLTPAPPYPVRVVHRWYDADGQEVPTQPIKAALPRTLPPEGVVEVPVRARTPDEPGDYRLRITLAQDGGVPFDELDPSAAADVRVRVLADGPAAEALAAFGLRPPEVQAARTAGSTVHDMIRALLARTGDGVNGLTAALIEERGRQEFVKALAIALGASERALTHSVAQALPDSDDVLLTGAEAVALTLRRSGVGIVFAGSGEPLLRDAMARLGLLAEVAGDRAAAIQAGGASMVRPGNGVAVLSGTRGLADALGALSDLRHDDIGMVAVVELPGDGEPGLPAACGAFVKSWYEPDGPPGDPEGRGAAAHALVATVRQALDDSRQAPLGPVLVALPRHLAETAWVPLTALPGAGRVIGETAGRPARQVAPVADVLGGVLGAVPPGVYVTGGAALATGLALGEPSARVVCGLGGQDGGDGVRELVAAARQAAPVTFVVCDGASRYGEIADALGVRSRRVDLSGRLDGDYLAAQGKAFAVTLQAMTDHPGPSLIELVPPAGTRLWDTGWISMLELPTTVGAGNA
ncbi:DUF4915 domain-containing protein [Nonomuraea zeae]|uniref:DUF4915 domain-containing protein n=1 Tax=Nonomuraea zeae TaxID=1642303 RepID=A0A5S4H3M8_9ACTN|nr:DUF4915 domain-containing protein [Nonomuraea zeae]TMR39853.1 DUF4915 domain-containing protein [Nonomuraea zeae]